jgi:hypothetical protein
MKRRIAKFFADAIPRSEDRDPVPLQASTPNDDVQVEFPTSTNGAVSVEEMIAALAGDHDSQQDMAGRANEDGGSMDDLEWEDVEGQSTVAARGLFLHHKRVGPVLRLLRSTHLTEATSTKLSCYQLQHFTKHHDQKTERVVCRASHRFGVFDGKSA